MVSLEVGGGWWCPLDGIRGKRVGLTELDRPDTASTADVETCPGAGERREVQVTVHGEAEHVVLDVQPGFFLGVVGTPVLCV